LQRVLDLDLDAFIYGAAHNRSSDAPRLNADEYPPWDLPKVLTFLDSQCLLTAPLPGFAVEHHGELFACWRDAIDNGVLVPPFHVTHVDAHADLGGGDAGYVYLLTELLLKPVGARHFPKVGDDGLGDGNYLAFAIANRWISDLAYVIGGRREYFEDEPDYPWKPTDLIAHLFEGSDPWTKTIRLPALDAKDLHDMPERRRPLSLEPPVPYSWQVWQRFQAAEPFDVICLARSPAFTPAPADHIYDEIRTRFIATP
jgi:hypothetical protein